MTFCGKDDPARGEQLELRCAASQLLARRLTQLVDPISDYRHNRERADVTARVDQLTRCAKIGAASRLGERPSGIKEPRADDPTLCEQMGDRVIGATRFADCREAVHQTIAQII